jgi:excisionase family DNA binding protein
MKDLLVEVTPAAWRLGCSKDNVRRLVDSGRLAAIRTANGQRLILGEALEEMARERSKRLAEREARRR